MLNKIFHKFSTFLIFIIVVYLIFTLFIIFPKIRTFFYEAEIKNIQNQLTHIENLINTESLNLKKFEELAFRNARDEIVRVTKTAHGIMQEYYMDYEKGKFSKEQALHNALRTIQKLKFGQSSQDDYIFALDSKGVYYLHPNTKYLHKSQLNIKDITGHKVTQEIVDKTLRDGEAFTTYFWPKATGKESYKKVTYSMYFKSFDMIIAAGVYIDNIQTETKLKSYVVLNDLKKMLKDHKILEKGFFYITDENSFLSYKESYTKAFQNQKGLLDKIKYAYENKQLFKYKLYNEQKISMVRYNDYFKWYIVAGIHKNDLYIKANELNKMILNMTLVILFIMFIVGLMMIQRVVTPINELTKNALKVKDGDFKVRNHVESNDETGILAQQFNFMLDNIEDNIKNLEIKIEERTKELKQQLYYDDLTGLKNRYSFLEYVKDEHFSTVVLMDINDFDDINELYGYKIGNEILIKFSTFADEFCRKKNMQLYRIYGNTFAILYLDDLFNFEEFESFIHSLLDNIIKYPLHIDELGIEIFLDVTLGIAICQDSPLKKANIALRKAKQSSTNFFVFNNEIDTKKVIENTIYWRNKIKDAIDSNKIIPFFQPIVNQKQEIIKYETLMRLEDQNDEGIISHISPYKFMDISIKTKQYATISNMLIGKALDSLKNTDKDISINLGFSDINNVHFLNFMDQKFSTLDEKYHSRIIFEILESDGILSYEVLEKFIEKYRKLGVRIAIDDFGTGYSNFSHIMKIRPDYLKIDSSLIKDIHVNKDSYELVKSVVVFSKALKIKTIAEFVHSKEVFDVTQSLGIDEFQGYYFGVPSSEFVTKIVSK